MASASTVERKKRLLRSSEWRGIDGRLVGQQYSISKAAGHCNSTSVLLQFGQVGIGSTQDSVATPQLIVALQNDKISQFACGWRHTLALTEQGQMYSWGRGVSGQLGHAETLDL